MKSCPTCSRTFEDTFTFCLADGSLLNAPVDPHGTLVIPEPRQTAPPPTEVLRPQKEIKKELPPTIASPEPPQPPRELASTIAAPAPKVELPHRSPSSAHSTGKFDRSPLILIGVGALLVFGIILFIIANQANSTNKNAANINTATANMAKSSTTVSNRNQTSNTSTSSPSPLLPPVTNLGGSVWKAIRAGKYEETFEFMSGGEMIRDGTEKGVWMQQGNKVSIKVGATGTHYGWILEGTIQGLEMSGWIEYIRQAGRESFTARRIK